MADFQEKESIKQKIYEEYMKYTSILIAEEFKSDGLTSLEDISIFMRSIRCLMENRKREMGYRMKRNLENEENFNKKAKNISPSPQSPPSLISLLPVEDPKIPPIFNKVRSFFRISSRYTYALLGCNEYDESYEHIQHYRLRTVYDSELVTALDSKKYPQLINIVNNALLRAVNDEEDENKKCGSVPMKKCGIDFNEKDQEENLKSCAKGQDCFRQYDGYLIPKKKEYYNLLQSDHRNAMVVILRLDGKDRASIKKDIEASSVKLFKNQFVGNDTLYIRHTIVDNYLEEEYANIVRTIHLECFKEKEARKDWYAYELYWLFANMCPMSRGSAGTAKVLLNAALIAMGFPMVQETSTYNRQADWVAMFTPDFEDFYTRKDELFEDIL